MPAQAGQVTGKSKMDFRLRENDVSLGGGSSDFRGADQSDVAWSHVSAVAFSVFSVFSVVQSFAFDFARFQDSE
jgi:hypothetical protein